MGIEMCLLPKGGFTLATKTAKKKSTTKKKATAKKRGGAKKPASRAKR
jgi:hypothetical protein